MSFRRRIRKVYYHVVKGSRYLLADERDKRRLLDLLCSVEREEGWLIYAFCITDHDAYFVIEASGSSSVRRGVQRLAGAFLRGEGAVCRGAAGRDASLAGDVLEMLESLGEIAIRCRQIHRVPLEQGYVNRLRDYWWSSYITYSGGYEWEVVDCRVLSLCFSADPEAARQRLLEFHR